jgi:hypothetical protein
MFPTTVAPKINDPDCDCVCVMYWSSTVNETGAAINDVDAYTLVINS